MDSLAGWVFVGTCFSLLLAMAQTRSRLHGRHGRLALAVAVGGIAATGLTLTLAWGVMPDERALVIGYVAAYVVPVAIMGVPGRRQLLSPSGLNAAARRQVFMVGAPGVITAPMYWVLASSDRWFLQVSTDAATVGIYSVACTFGQLGMMVNSALLAIWLPEATRLHESDAVDNERLLAAVMARLLVLMALVWLCVGVLGGDLLCWLTAEKFHSAAPLIPWLASAVFFYGFYHLANTGLFLGRGLKWSALLSAGAGVVSMAGNAVLVPRYGMLAAAMVQCGSFALLAVMVLVLAQRRHPLPLPFVRLSVALVIVVSGLLVGQSLPAVNGLLTALWKLAFLAVNTTLIFLVVEPGVLKQCWRALRRWTSKREVYR
jgi:O-antigen/teichoic acid export membrane protein